MKNWFQSLPLKCDLQRYTAACQTNDERIIAREWAAEGKAAVRGSVSGGAVQVELCLTHSLKATGFQTLTFEHQSWFQNVPANSTCATTERGAAAMGAETGPGRRGDSQTHSHGQEVPSGKALTAGASIELPREPIELHKVTTKPCVASPLPSLKPCVDIL